MAVGAGCCSHLSVSSAAETPSAAARATILSSTSVILMTCAPGLMVMPARVAVCGEQDQEEQRNSSSSSSSSMRSSSSSSSSMHSSSSMSSSSRSRSSRRLEAVVGMGMGMGVEMPVSVLETEGGHLEDRDHEVRSQHTVEDVQADVVPGVA